VKEGAREGSREEARESPSERFLHLSLAKIPERREQSKESVKTVPKCAETVPKVRQDSAKIVPKEYLDIRSIKGASM
jgi:hypothetical protein